MERVLHLKALVPCSSNMLQLLYTVSVCVLWVFVFFAGFLFYFILVIECPFNASTTCVSIWFWNQLAWLLRGLDGNCNWQSKSLQRATSPGSVEMERKAAAAEVKISLSVSEFQGLNSFFVLHVPGVNASPARTRPQKKYLMSPNS